MKIKDVGAAQSVTPDIAKALCLPGIFRHQPLEQQSVAALAGIGQRSAMQLVETLDPRRRRILWRCCHRGIKEMDILLGGFAQARLAAMTDAELAALEAIVELPDQEMLTWATGQVVVPAEHASPLLSEMLCFRP